MKKNKGISLIVLIITIIIIIILAGTVILSLADNNPIAAANGATIKSNVKNYDSELSLTLAKKYLNNHSFDPNNFFAGVWDGNEDHISGTIKEYIPSIKKEDAKNFKIQGSKIVYVGTDPIVGASVVDVGIENGVPPKVDKNVEATENSTIKGIAPSFDNPIIPKGFMAVNTTDASWDMITTDWNKGLVIQDTALNQFVWVPVDGTNVKYAKSDTSIPMDYEDVLEGPLPTGIVNESYQVKKYGGFYIARFEAGKDNNTLVSKQGAVVWTNISYTNSVLQAMSMHNEAGVKSGLVTGTQWDTTAKWIQNAGFNAESDSTAWGNYLNSAVTEPGVKQVTGYSESWKANNIYDLAGNANEITNELVGSVSIILRGGDCRQPGNLVPVVYRDATNYSTSGGPYMSFRMVLYIL
jgi:hypothetical protein